MKILLLRDVAKIGKRGSIVEVPDGYAINKLIPQAMAVPATKSVEKQKKDADASKADHNEKIREDLKRALALLQDSPLRVQATANTNQHLFKAVSVHDIHAALALRFIDIPATALAVPVIKELGLFQCTVSYVGVHGTIPVEVISS
jgi:large subunit ribosomal protein L9